jgi:hypothetical protein
MFDKASFAVLVENTGWTIESIEYFFSFVVLPAFVFRRLLAPLRPTKRLVIPRATAPGNRFWPLLYSVERKLNHVRLGPPCGTSLMAVLRRVNGGND